MMDGAMAIGGAAMTEGTLAALSTKAASTSNIEATAREFEAMFATQMLKPMFDTVPVNKTFGGGNAEAIMRTFMLQEYGKMIAEKELLGIAPRIKAVMLRAQEAHKDKASTEKTSAAQTAQKAYKQATANNALTTQGVTHVSVQ